MTNPEEELRRREQELEKRERAIRLREIEEDIYQQEPFVHQTTPVNSKPSRLKRWKNKIIKVAKFAALMIVGIAAVQLGAWLAGVVIVGGLGWLGYKLFLDSQNE